MAEGGESVDGNIAPESVQKLSRGSRSSSRDELSDPPNVAALRKALNALDANNIDELAKKCLWTADTILDTQKFRNPLHELVIQYSSACEAAPVENSALHKKFQDCVSVLLEYGVDVNEGDAFRNTALHLLCQNYGVAAGIQTLLASGAKVNAVNSHEQTALHHACEDGTVKEIDALLNGGADATAMDCVSLSPLHYAVRYRRSTDVVKSLIGSGASVDLQAEKRHKPAGPAPLHVAVRNDRKENVKLLLELDANPDVVDSSGQTPLHLAATYDITSNITRMLIQGGAFIDSKDVIYGETAIHKAIKRNMLHNVKVLCDSGASLSEPDLNGDSPLHRAAISCHDMDVWVALLSAKQADIRIRNSKAQTVLDRAARASNKLAVNVLKQVEG